MAKFVMKNGSFWISKSAKNLTATAATKGASTVITATHALAIGDHVYISGSGWAALDGKVLNVSAVTGTTAFTVDADTAAATGAFATTAIIVPIAKSGLVEACLSGFDIESGGNDSISVGTFCDAGAQLAGAGSNGTASISGFVDPKDPGYLELVAASADGLPRTFILRLPLAADASGTTHGGEYYMVNATVGSLSQSFQSGAAVTFSGSLTLTNKAIFVPAA